MRTRSLKWVAGVAGVVGISIAACGGDGSSSSSFNDGQGSGSTDASSGGGNYGNLGGGGRDSGSSSGDSGSNGSPSSGVVATCIAGSQGCLCDARGQCAPGLTCTAQPGGKPALCCSGPNCSGSGTGIGTVCPPGSGAAATCTPGSITIPPATAGSDTCGYATSTFNENIIFCGMTATGGGNASATINVFYNDEHAIPLGCANASNPVSPYPGTPTALYYPKTGDPACTDTVKRPMRPVLYITDITADPSCTSGDQQHGGKPYYPVAIFGSWKTATENGSIGQPAGGDPASNGWNLGPGADPVPASVTSACAGGKGGGFGAEIQFAAGLIPGHSYRLQTILHDGDQTRGADSGEGCAIFCAAAGAACQPLCGACTSNADCCSGLTCSNGACGSCSDGGVIK